MNKLTLPTLLTILISVFYSCETKNNEVDSIAISDSTHNDSIKDVHISPKQDAEPIKTKTFDYFEDYADLTSNQELIDAFGKDNVREGSSWYAEGTIELKHTIINNPENNHIIKYLWDEEQTDKLSSIEASYYEWNDDFEVQSTQKIKSKCGTYTGMPINDLRKWNEADFSFSGFGWDYEGGVFVEKDSKLESCDTRIKLGLMNINSNNKFDGLIGDIELSTNDEKVKKAAIILETMYYSIKD